MLSLTLLRLHLLAGRINEWNRKGQETVKLPKAKVLGLDAVEAFGGEMLSASPNLFFSLLVLGERC